MSTPEQRIRTLVDRLPDSDAITVAKVDVRVLFAEIDRLRAIEAYVIAAERLANLSVPVMKLRLGRG